MANQSIGVYELAYRAHCTAPTIYSWLSGKSSIRSKTLANIMFVLGIDSFDIRSEGENNEDPFDEQAST